MFQYCHALERLSINNVTWGLDDENDCGQLVSQGMLIKMVRHHPTLKWLRSHLSYGRKHCHALTGEI
jgi:hypothetical protein